MDNLNDYLSAIAHDLATPRIEDGIPFIKDFRMKLLAARWSCAAARAASRLKIRFEHSSDSGGLPLGIEARVVIHYPNTKPDLEELLLEMQDDIQNLTRDWTTKLTARHV